MTVYVDTSFFVSLYLPDRHSTNAERWLATARPQFLTQLHVAEWSHAIEQHVFRKEVTPSQAVTLHRVFKEHCEKGTWREVAMPESAYVLCAELARRHAGRLGLRTLDTLHVAAALELQATIFWTFDERQAKLAKAEGLKTLFSGN